MAARSITSGTISFGLVSIPVKVYVAASPQSVRFNQLHAECASRIKSQLYCPVCDRSVERSETVKGYEYARGQYVRFTDAELKELEAEKTHSLDIVEFVPLDSVDLVQVERSYYLGPDKGGDKAYRLLADAMERTGKVAVGRYWTRGKEQLVLVRPYRDGLLLHYVYYADEVRSFDEIDRGEGVQYREGELQLAEQLVEQLAADGFRPESYRDQWRDRVMEAVEQKVAGEEITAAPAQPAAQVIDLFEALKQSLGQAPGGDGQTAPAEPAAEAKPDRLAAPKKAKGNGQADKGDERALKPPRKAQPRGGRSGGKKKGKTGSG